MTGSATARHLEVRTAFGLTTARFRGRDVSLYGEVAQEAAAEVAELVNGMEGKTLALNFAAVAYIGSTMLAKLALLHKQLQAGGTKLVLWGLRPNVYEAFQLTRLTTIMDIQPGGPDAPVA
jgi:anti-anti-sigma factor